MGKHGLTGLRLAFHWILTTTSVPAQITVGAVPASRNEFMGTFVCFDFKLKLTTYPVGISVSQTQSPMNV